MRIRTTDTLAEDVRERVKRESPSMEAHCDTLNDLLRLALLDLDGKAGRPSIEIRPACNRQLGAYTDLHKGTILSKTLPLRL